MPALPGPEYCKAGYESANCRRLDSLRYIGSIVGPPVFQPLLLADVQVVPDGVYLVVPIFNPFLELCTMINLSQA